MIQLSLGVSVSQNAVTNIINSICFSSQNILD